MANVKVTVDDEVIADGDLGQWSNNPPPLLEEQLKAGARPRPWMRALLLTVADAAMRDRAMDITVHTKPGDGWTLDVDLPV